MVTKLNQLMNKTFTAIDFETAHGKRWSICQVGLVRVENGLITKDIEHFGSAAQQFLLG